MTHWPQIALTLACLLLQVLSSLGSSNKQAQSCIRRPKQEMEEPSRRQNQQTLSALNTAESRYQLFSESDLSSLKGDR